MKFHAEASQSNLGEFQTQETYQLRHILDCQYNGFIFNTMVLFQSTEKMKRGYKFSVNIFWNDFNVTRIIAILPNCTPWKC